MGVEYTGAGGVRQFYGPRLSPTTKPDPAPQTESSVGNIRELEIRFAFDNVPNPSATSTNDALELVIPANSFIVDARLYQEAAWVGGTSIAIDSRATADGSVATANGFVTATQGATANLGANTWITGSGGLIGATVGTSDVKVGCTVVGTYTAGRSKLVIRYVVPN